MPNLRGPRGTDHGGHGLCLWTQTAGGESRAHLGPQNKETPHSDAH